MSNTLVPIKKLTPKTKGIGKRWLVYCKKCNRLSSVTSSTLDKNPNHCRRCKHNTFDIHQAINFHNIYFHIPNKSVNELAKTYNLKVSTIESMLETVREANKATLYLIKNKINIPIGDINV